MIDSFQLIRSHNHRLLMTVLVTIFFSFFFGMLFAHDEPCLAHFPSCKGNEAS